jgi:hypothetical protein
MTALANGSQIVMAKLRSGSYDLVGSTADLPSDLAMDLMHRTSLGDLQLRPGARALAIFHLNGKYLLVAASPGKARELSGRPWIFRRVVVLKPEAFASIDFNAFAIEHALLQQEPFDKPRVIPLFSLTDAVHASSEWPVRSSPVTPTDLTLGLASVLLDRPVFWQNCADALDLLRTIFELLPRAVLRKITFASDTACWPALPALVVASTHGIVRSQNDNDRMTLEFGRGSFDGAQWHDGPPGEIARTLTRWKVEGDDAILRAWRESVDVSFAGEFDETRWSRVNEVMLTLLRWHEMMSTPRFAGMEGIAEAIARGVVPPAPVLRDCIAREADGDLFRLASLLRSVKEAVRRPAVDVAAAELIKRDLSGEEVAGFIETFREADPEAGRLLTMVLSAHLAEPIRIRHFIRRIRSRELGARDYAVAFRHAWHEHPEQWTDVTRLIAAVLFVGDGTSLPEPQFWSRAHTHYGTRGYPRQIVDVLQALAAAHSTPSPAGEAIAGWASLLTTHETDVELGPELAAEAIVWFLSQLRAAEEAKEHFRKLKQSGIVAWYGQWINAADAQDVPDRPMTPAMLLVALLTAESDHTSAHLELLRPHAARVLDVARTALLAVGVLSFSRILRLALVEGMTQSWAARELNQHVDAVEATLYKVDGEAVFDGIARFADASTDLSDEARGMLFRVAVFLAAKQDVADDRRRQWLVAIARSGMKVARPVALSVSEGGIEPARLAATLAEAGRAVVERVTDRAEVRRLCRELSEVTGQDASQRWFDACAQEAAQRLAILEGISQAGQASRAQRIKASATLKDLRERGWLSRTTYWLFGAALPRRWLGLRRVGSE